MGGAEETGAVFEGEEEEYEPLLIPLKQFV
jgi:hypothetical protein